MGPGEGRLLLIFQPAGKTEECIRKISEGVTFNQVPDSNGGQELPANPLFGELVAGTPIIPPAQAAKGAAPQKNTVPKVEPENVANS